MFENENGKAYAYFDPHNFLGFLYHHKKFAHSRYLVCMKLGRKFKLKKCEKDGMFHWVLHVYFEVYKAFLDKLRERKRAYSAAPANLSSLRSRRNEGERKIMLKKGICVYFPL